MNVLVARGFQVDVDLAFAAKVEKQKHHVCQTSKQHPHVKISVMSDTILSCLGQADRGNPRRGFVTISKGVQNLMNLKSPCTIFPVGFANSCSAVNFIAFIVTWVKARDLVLGFAASSFLESRTMMPFTSMMTLASLVWTCGRFGMAWDGDLPTKL
eukprot:193361-Amphidinium_carterae.1